MRDIGKSRRKARGHPQISLEVQEFIGNDAPTKDHAGSKEENGAGTSFPHPREIDSTRRTHSHLQPQNQPKENDLSTGLGLPAIDRTWTGRSNPFVKYPV
jgi:hypothetical protein